MRCVYRVWVSRPAVRKKVLPVFLAGAGGESGYAASRSVEGAWALALILALPSSGCYAGVPRDEPFTCGHAETNQCGRIWADNYTMGGFGSPNRAAGVRSSKVRGQTLYRLGPTDRITNTLLRGPFTINYYYDQMPRLFLGKQRHRQTSPPCAP